jgi:hypothetical protein
MLTTIQVIVPIISAALADGNALARVQVLKPLAMQMFHLLRARVSGLANRQIFYLPFHRGVDIDRETIDKIQRILRRCVECGGVLLAQPEHILSFKLMALERLQSCKGEVRTKLASSLWQTQQWLDRVSRDILDESDEILHTRYQLIYTIGQAAPLDGQPDRWNILGQIFSVMLECVWQVVAQHPEGLDVVHPTGSSCAFPMTRILSQVAGRDLLKRTIQDAIYRDRLPSMNIPLELREQAMLFITDLSIPETARTSLCDRLAELDDVTLFPGLLVLRGLFAHGILELALTQKRWRVDYGLDLGRSLMAVPYRAKDSPSLRSEYGVSSPMAKKRRLLISSCLGHPEMRLVLTTLCEPSVYEYLYSMN